MHSRNQISKNNATKIVKQEIQLSVHFDYRDRLINSHLLSLFLSLFLTLSHILGVFGYFIARRMCASNTASCFIRFCVFVCVCLFGFVLFRGISAGIVLLPPLSLIISTLMLSSILVTAMLRLDQPELIDNFAIFVIGHLLEVQMRAIVRLEASVSIILTMKCTPLGYLTLERFSTLFAARRASDEMHWRTWILIRRAQRSIAHLVVINRPQSLVRVLVRPDGHIHTVLIEQWFQPEHMHEGPTDSGQCLRVGAIVIVLVAAVHRSMAIDNDPRSLGTILRQIGLFQILP